MKVEEIFNVAKDVESVICPPEMVFKDQGFDFFLTRGGHVADDSEMYESLMGLLRSLGESKFYISENLGCTGRVGYKHREPFKEVFPTDSTLLQFNQVLKKHEEDFGLSMDHWFVNGDSNDWGIYLSEYPFLNIVGCKPNLIGQFRDVFLIKGNGYAEVEEIIKIDLINLKDRNQFLETYNISTYPNTT